MMGNQMITWDRENRSVTIRRGVFTLWVTTGRLVLRTKHCFLHISRATRIFNLDGLGYQFAFQWVVGTNYSAGHIGLYQLADTNKGVFYHSW